MDRFTVILQSGLGFGDEEPAAAPERAASIEETYFLDLRTVGVKNVKDIVFLHGEGRRQRRLASACYQC